MNKIALIFLHGSGGSGIELRTFLDCVPLQKYEYKTFNHVSSSLNISYYTPTASERRYTAAFGMPMNVWFDRSSQWNRLGVLDPFEDIIGIDSSISQIIQLLKQIECRFEHIFIGGFSMGGGLCIHLLRQKDLPKNVRGFFTMGSFLVGSSVVFQNEMGPASKLPWLMMHGTSDSMIPLSWGEGTASSLLLKGIDVEFRSYRDIDHAVGEVQLEDLIEWISDVTSKHELEHQHQQQVSSTTSTSSGSMSASTSTSTASAHTVTVERDIDTLPYRIEAVPLAAGSSSGPLYRVIFPVPSSIVSMLISRPEVQTVVSSANPDKTAREIAIRLAT
eukprot:gene9373-19449_t